MASKAGGERRCFTFIWKLENARYCLQEGGIYHESPLFTVNEMQETKWRLELVSFVGSDGIAFCVRRQPDCRGAEKVETECELAFLSYDGTVLKSFWEIKSVSKTGYCGTGEFATRNEVFLSRRSEFLHQDTLTARCRMWKTDGEMWNDVQYSARTRIPVEEILFSWNIEDIEFPVFESGAVEKKEKDNCSSDKENKLILPKSVLIDDLKSLLDNSILSDVKLKTNTQTYPAHKNILSIRSPVFKAMFSRDMKEKINDCVEIEDLNDDTVSRMLRYIYSGEVEDLSWSSATELYEAADKYEILPLNYICSSYLKRNLDLNNACEALVLSDLHQDEDLKSFVQDFILEHGKDIINSEEWGQLMEANVKLAAETMRLRYKK